MQYITCSRKLHVLKIIFPYEMINFRLAESIFLGSLNLYIFFSFYSKHGKCFCEDKFCTYTFLIYIYMLHIPYFDIQRNIFKGKRETKYSRNKFVYFDLNSGNHDYLW